MGAPTTPFYTSTTPYPSSTQFTSPMYQPTQQFPTTTPGYGQQQYGQTMTSQQPLYGSTQAPVYLNPQQFAPNVSREIRLQSATSP